MNTEDDDGECAAGPYGPHRLARDLRALLFPEDDVGGDDYSAVLAVVKQLKEKTRVATGRADTPLKKLRVMDRIGNAWLKVPHLRLGQLLHSAMSPKHALFYIEDNALTDFVEEFVERNRCGG